MILKKLMKYDLKKMTKVLVFIYAITIFLAIITRLVNIGKDIQFLKILGGVCAGFTYSAIASVFINTFIHIIVVFVTSFYKDPSYLTHTLPVSKNKLLLSKYLSGIVVVFASFLTTFISLFIMLYSKDFMNGLKAMLSSVVSGLNISSGLLVVLLFFVLLFQICSMMSIAFAGIINGHSHNNKKGLYSLVYFLVYYFASSFLSVVLVAIILLFSGNISVLFDTIMPQWVLLFLIVFAAVFNILCSALMYIVAQKSFNKGVNVD